MTETAETLALALGRARGKPVIFDGQPVVRAARFQASESNLELRVRARSTRPRALELKAADGNLRRPDLQIEEEGVRIWADKEPDQWIHLEVLPTAQSTELIFWNSWSVDSESGENLINAWMGPSGFRLEKHEDGVRMRCNDESPIDFEDLVADLRGLDEDAVDSFFGWVDSHALRLDEALAQTPP